MPPAVEAWSLNHWTAWEFLGVLFNVRAGPHSARTVLDLGCLLPAPWVGHAAEEAGATGGVGPEASPLLACRFLASVDWWGKGPSHTLFRAPVFSLPVPCEVPHPTQ